MSNNGSSSGGSAKPTWLNKIAKEKTSLLQRIFEMEPIHVDVKHPVTKKLRPRCQGEDILRAWDECYSNDPLVKNIVVDTAIGPSTPGKDYYDDPSANPAMPYQQLRALIGDGGKWKWPEIWKNLDILPRRGLAWRHIDDPSNLGAIANPNPDVVPLNCLVVGGGPVGLRLAIELILGGHRVTVFERRREIRDPDTGGLQSAGFTNRVNRPHIKNFCRNDLDRLNGRNFMTPKMCYPVFTNAHTSSIGIDEAQMMLLKTALFLGVNFELGVGYEGGEIEVDEEATNQRPYWNVEYTADEIARQRFNKQASGGKQRFDALFGCDGGNSRVRNTQVDWLGVPKTRKYKKMYGIVANLQKCSRAKLKSLGFETGLEPEDRAGNLTGVFFYKASYHNYLIVHPSAEEMEANGIPWRGIFGFHKARADATSARSQETAALKETLKKYMAKKAKELQIPLDETLSNGGFVDAPNDVMGFDFSEFYNCENSAACMVPPLDWNADEDGDWEVNCPLVALAGDAVADPNWLLGVGLQRGWNSALDACFYADNVYNNKSFNGNPSNVDEPIQGPIEWSDHMDNLARLMTNLGNNSRDGKLSEEMQSGMLDEKGPVVLQLAKMLAHRDVDAPVPQYLPVVEPWYRYQEYERAIRKNYDGKKLFDNIHPTTTRELAIFRKTHQFVEKGVHIRKTTTRPTAAMITWPKRFACSAFWCDMSMKLISIDGKTAPGAKKVERKTAECFDEEKKEEERYNRPERPKIKPPEVQRVGKISPTGRKNSIVAAALATRSPASRSPASRSPASRSPASRSPKPPTAFKQRSASLQSSILSAAKSYRPSDPPFSESPGKDKSSYGVNRGMPSAESTPKQSPVATVPESTSDFIGNLSGIPSSIFASAAATPSDPKDPLHQLRLLTVRYERDLCKARLEVARTKMAKVEAEEAVLRATKACAQEEVEALSNMMAAYAGAESKFLSMGGQ